MKTQFTECLCKMSECSKQNFNWELLIGSLIVVIGWFISHYFSQKRDSKNKKKEIVLDFLIRTYRILSNDISNREINTIDSKYKFECLISDLQLFGSIKQVELAKNIALEMRTNGNSNLDELINDLRDSLREELNLNKVKGNVEYIRYLN